MGTQYNWEVLTRVMVQVCAWWGHQLASLTMKELLYSAQSICVYMAGSPASITHNEGATV